jgi:O-antigen/teichoic acid export membrane protein
VAGGHDLHKVLITALGFEKLGKASDMSSLGKQAASGILWTTGLSVFRDFLQFGTMLVLVRLLAPEIYGQFGLVSAIMGFLSVFSFRVFLEHTLQIRPGGEVDYQMHFTAGAVLQGALFLVSNVAAEVLNRIPVYAPVAPVVHVMSILFLLDLGSEFRVKMLEREMDWGRLRVLQGIGVVASAALSLIMAAAGAGVYALLVPTLLYPIPALADLFLTGWRPTWRWNAASFAAARAYGLTRLMSALVIWSRQLMESTFLVKIVGFALFGIYGRALGLAAICCLKAPSLLTQALFPVLTKLEPGSARSSRACTLVLCSVAWPTFPIAVIFAVASAPVVRTIYGPRWAGTIPFVPWAMAAGAATALAQTCIVLLVAGLQQKRSLYVDAIVLAGTAACLLLLAPRSLQSYLVGTTFVQAFALILMLVWLYHKQSIDLQGIASSLILPAVNAAVSFLGLEAIRTWLGLSRGTVGGAVLYGAAFCLIYVLLLRLTSRQQCREFVDFLPGRSYLQRWLVLGA